MKTILKLSIVSTALVLMLVTDIPLLPKYLDTVPEVQAIFGARRRTRRRTAVVAYSAGAASATAAAAAASSSQPAAQQQAAPAQEQAAATPPPAPAPAASGPVPLGTVVQALPGDCTSVVVSKVEYHDCGGSFYKAAFQGNNLVYAVVQNPLPQ